MDTLEELRESQEKFANRLREFNTSKNEAETEYAKGVFVRNDERSFFEIAADFQKKIIKKDALAQVVGYTDNLKKVFLTYWQERVGDRIVLLPENRKKVENIIRWAICDPESEIPIDKSIWLWGNVGSGKSKFAQSIHDLQSFFHNPPQPFNFNGKRWDFVDMDQVYVNAKLDPSALAALNTKYSLVLDEVKESHFFLKTFGNDNRIIGDVLSARYSAWQRNSSRTLITSNLDPSKMKEILDDRELDRMREMFCPVHWSGESFRGK